MTADNTILVNIILWPGPIPEDADPGPDVFQAQLTQVRRSGLKTTVLMTRDALRSDAAVRLVREGREQFGGEIGLFLSECVPEQSCQNRETGARSAGTVSAEDRKAAVREALEQFRDVFGFSPESVGVCREDAELIRTVKAEEPSVRCAAVISPGESSCTGDPCGCFQYPFRDGGPWAPWIPSGANVYAPAANGSEDSGVVAIPLFGPKLPAFCGGAFLCPVRISQAEGMDLSCDSAFKSFEDACACWGKRKKEGRLTDLTMSGFADLYRASQSYTAPECAFLRDPLDGSEKRRFWYCDPYMRVCVDMDRGGAIVDLRPYIAKPEGPAGTACAPDAGYPFLIREEDRGESATRGAQEGTVRSARLCWNGEEADLCGFRTQAAFSREGEDRILTLDPVDVVFSDGLTVKLQSVVTFCEGSACIRVDRKLLSVSDPAAEITVREYLTACCGAAGSPDDLTAMTLSIEAGEEDSVSISCAGESREAASADAEEVSCSIPPMKTRVCMLANGRRRIGFIQEGDAGDPMFTLGWERRLKEQEIFTTWLNLEREG